MYFTAYFIVALWKSICQFMANPANAINKLLTGHLISCGQLHIFFKKCKGAIFQASFAGQDLVANALISHYWE